MMESRVSLTQSRNINQSSNLSNQTINETISSYAFVPYNKKWGSSQILGSVPAMISLDQKCIIKLEETTSYINTAICDCLGSATVKSSKAKYVTFDVEYSEKYGCYVIDADSFQLYYGSKSQLGQLQPCGVFLEISTFIAPDGQVWATEKQYEEYISSMNVIFECSDGSLVSSYSDFKTWEKELALRPNNPNYEVLPYKTPLVDIEHYKVDSDGTIWRDATILHEYLAWRSDRNHNYQDGYYCGAYGIANSFKEYAKLYNARYFTINGFRRDEQHLDPTYNLLFVNQAMADDYIKRLKSFQKKM